ncbi:MAG: ferritin-like domain-containing protein [Acidimicrobiales bacterium]
MEPADRDRLITTLCNYCVGETAALDGASGMIDFAPNRHAKIFLATQVVDEARHLEVFLHRLQSLGVADPEAEIERRANPNLLVFKQRLHDLVAARDWEASVFAQNVVLETMESTVFVTHARSADALTAEILDGVIKDERRHLGFGENDLGGLLVTAPELRGRLADLRAELDPLVLGSFEAAASDERRVALGRDYLDAVERLGLT